MVDKAKLHKRLTIAMIAVMISAIVAGSIVLGLALSGYFDEKDPDVCPDVVAGTPQPAGNPAYPIYEPAATPDYCK